MSSKLEVSCSEAQVPSSKLEVSDEWWEQKHQKGFGLS
ncbi:hypothetical protein GXM_01823 [Nostoc sphaeroides CCNUC1]|uniref:Uncharacterized protein n=1 Tax=Nostoc sphaeroides CCNUC1 TaxID=2653204 RepID=A0A5P8VVF2_9NOSO|nr:hypothetical protein GXM_01823 [Nostoc sphaeroides CCNUC1]